MHPRVINVDVQGSARGRGAGEPGEAAATSDDPDDTESVAAEQDKDAWVAATARSLRACTHAWAAMAAGERVEAVLEGLAQLKLTDAVHRAVLEELVVHQQRLPAGVRRWGWARRRHEARLVELGVVKAQACLQKRRIKIPGGTLWRYLRVCVCLCAV